ncbi:HIRAN domain-containing protein [Bradyrhizobium sp. RT6a]|uniref:HIRAN domain-containing protein n=1 Tax=unclassified Bradyrhizobium TaxID=2631580 RepID=UPI003398DEED
MEKRIQHVREPHRLILAWQAPDQFKMRFRWAVGELSLSDGIYTFRYFNADEFSKLNDSRKIEELLSLGYRGYPAFAPSKHVYTNSVISPFLRRLPPRSRTDFSDYMAGFHVDPSITLSDFALLSITEGKLPSDGFSLVDEYLETEGPRELFVELAGHRHYRHKLQHPLVIGRDVELAPEPNNPVDPNAVMVRSSGECIGYINRLQAKAFSTWIRENRVVATLERLDGSVDKPRAFVFTTISQ